MVTTKHTHTQQQQKQQKQKQKQQKQQKQKQKQQQLQEHLTSSFTFRNRSLRQKTCKEECQQTDSKQTLDGQTCMHIRQTDIIRTESRQTCYLVRRHLELSVFHSDQILGGLAISGSEDGTIYFWDLMEGECEAAIQAHEGPVHALEYNGQEHFFTGGGYVRKHCLL